jgi:hypothetical protein
VKDAFGDEESALATCDAALQWLMRYRDAHGGVFSARIFNALIRLRPSCVAEFSTASSAARCGPAGASPWS